MVHSAGICTRDICLTTRSLRMSPSRLVVRPEQATWKVSTPGRGVTGGLLRCPRAGAVTTNFCAAQRLTTVALRARGSRLRDGKSWRMPWLKIRAPIYARGCVFIGDTATRPDAGCPRSVLPWSVLVVLFYSEDKISTLPQRVDHNKGFVWSYYNNEFSLNIIMALSLTTTTALVSSQQWNCFYNNNSFCIVTTMYLDLSQQYIKSEHNNGFGVITAMSLVLAQTQQWF